MVQILSADIQDARAARPDLTDDALIEEACLRGLRIASENAGDDLAGVEASTELRIASLRIRCAVSAASVAELRTRLVVDRERYESSAEEERRTYLEFVQLDRDVVPPLKMEARQLRAEVRRLEAEAEAMGIDISAVHPLIEWAQTLAVEGYEPPLYVSNESRRRTALAFFRRRDEA